MAAKPILNIRIAPETLQRLDAIAAATRRSRSFIANEALEAWISREIELIEDIRIGLEEARAGKGIPHEEAMRRIDAAVEAAAKRAPRRSRAGRR
jgi:predicted transcriptional regulator